VLPLPSKIHMPIGAGARYSVDVEGKGAVRVEACAFGARPAVVVVHASMTVWAGLWDGKSDALLLLGLLLVHGLEDFLAIFGHSLHDVSKSVNQFRRSNKGPYSYAGGVAGGRHGELIKWYGVQVLLTVEQLLEKRRHGGRAWYIQKADGILQPDRAVCRSCS
jgi:hypothetical protein